MTWPRHESLARDVLSLAIDAGIPKEKLLSDPRVQRALEALQPTKELLGETLTTARNEARYV